MKRVIAVTVLVWSFFILQSTVFQDLAVAGISPSLLVVLVSAFGFMRGEKEGLVIGFASGLLCDIFYSNVLGPQAFMLMCIGYLNGKFHGGFYPEDYRLPIVLIVLSDITHSFMEYIVYFLMRGRFDIWHYLSHVILPEAAYTFIAAVALYPLVLAINKRLERAEAIKRRERAGIDIDPDIEI